MKRNEPKEAKEKQEQVSPEREADSFGTWLRRQRLGRDIDLREIADSSKISLRYLQALEEDRFEILPAPVFAKGFLRQYARYVGLDPEEVVNFYQSTRDEIAQQEEPETLQKPKASASPWAYLLFLLIGALLIGVVWFLSFLKQQEELDAVAAPAAVESALPSPPPAVAVVTAEISPQAALEAPPTPAAGDSSPLRVVLDFNGECWIEASIDGSSTVSEIRVQGESLQLSAEREIDLKLGNYTVVDIEVNGMAWAIEAVGSSSVQRLTIDLATVSELSAAAEKSGGAPAPSGDGEPSPPSPDPPATDVEAQPSIDDPTA